MKEKRHVISRVLPGSIAEELELEPGDVLTAINGQPVEDVFDYRYLMNDEYVTLLVEKADGELWELEVEKEFEEDLGAEFENGLMGRLPFLQQPLYLLLHRSDASRNARYTVFQGRRFPAVFSSGELCDSDQYERRKISTA